MSEATHTLDMTMMFAVHDALRRDLAQPAIADRESGPQRLGEVVDAHYLSVAGRLRHEEDEGLRLVESVLTPGQWAAFGQDHQKRVGAESARHLPWLLQGASPETAVAILGRMPEEIKRAYATEWRAEYLDVRPWNPRIR
ncbi:hypothetical protein ACQP0U_21715 [Micromonospora sp. CA-269861]|uniref:hypothetical protein n=1 Tax=Micromonospora sp. CA-269861 TaxID=3239968 RepID=UPI003D8FA556